MDLTPDTRIFVTGGSGFVGRELIAALHARGCLVTALARSRQAAATVRAWGAEPARGDLSDLNALAAGMTGCTGVIHAAADVRDWGRRADFRETTIHGTERVLEAARMAGIRRLVHIGTEAVLAAGRPIVDADETVPYPADPVGLYPWSKALAEQAVLAANAPMLATVSVRPRLVWGRGDTSLLPPVLAAMRAGRWAWFGGGHHPTSTCHVRNVAEGALLALEAGAGGEIYFLTDGPPVDFRDFLTAIAATQGVAAPNRTAPMWLASGLAAAGEAAWRALRLPGRPPLTRTALNLLFREVTVSDAKARLELGYTSHVSIGQGLAEMQEASGSF